MFMDFLCFLIQEKLYIHCIKVIRLCHGSRLAFKSQNFKLSTLMVFVYASLFYMVGFQASKLLS